MLTPGYGIVIVLGAMLVEAARDVPPPPKHHGYKRIMNMVRAKYMDGVIREIDQWDENDAQNIWELSGHFEGDIMVDEDDDLDFAPSFGIERNAVRDIGARWPGGVVPYHISDDFDEDDVSTIEGAMEDFHENSCIKFRPYRRGDRNWITIRGDAPGCWSYVGRRTGGQVVNLGRRCVHHGVASHELLHALGFHHQQSAADRDEYVRIHWRNIRSGTENNFRKFGSGRVTDFDVPYDYTSVMHYSTHAFSKNGKPTITPKKVGARIGQRERMSDRDLEKLNIMYDCDEEDRKRKKK